MQISPVGQLFMAQPAAAGEKQETKGGSFADAFDSAMKNLNDTQIRADNTALELLAGDIQDIHQVTIAMEEAKLTMQLALEVRNKVIEAYQEVYRMQV